MGIWVGNNKEEVFEPKEIKYGESRYVCEIGKKLWTNKCPSYDAYRKNAEGKPARKLGELMDEASQEPQLAINF